MIKISPNISIISGCVVTFVAAVVTFVFTLSTPSTAHIKGASTTKPGRTTDSQTTVPANGQTVAPATSDNAAAALTAPHSSSMQSASNPASSTATPDQSAPSGSTSPSNGSPAPEPTFHIAFEQSYAYQPPFNPDIHQQIAPFDITFDPGFTPGAADMPGCTFLDTPAQVDGHTVLCNVSEKDKGYLGIQYDDSSAHGHYKVQISYTLGSVTHTATTEFDI